jgi:hypothetical protein
MLPLFWGQLSLAGHPVEPSFKHLDYFSEILRRDRVDRLSNRIFKKLQTKLPLNKASQLFIEDQYVVDSCDFYSNLFTNRTFLCYQALANLEESFPKHFKNILEILIAHEYAHMMVHSCPLEKRISLIKKQLNLKESDFKSEGLRDSKAVTMESFLDHLNQDILAIYIIEHFLGGINEKTKKAYQQLNDKLDLIGVHLAPNIKKVRNHVFHRSIELFQDTKRSKRPVELPLFLDKGCFFDQSMQGLKAKIKGAPAKFMRTYFSDKEVLSILKSLNRFY